MPGAAFIRRRVNILQYFECGQFHLRCHRQMRRHHFAYDFYSGPLAFGITGIGASRHGNARSAVGSMVGIIKPSLSMAIKMAIAMADAAAL